MEKMNDRVLICEKMLKYTNLTKSEKEWQDFEIKIEDMIEKCIEPSHTRVISYGQKLDQFAKLFQQTKTK